VKALKPLSDADKLNVIKFIHTAIWVVFVAAILYVLYAGIFDKVTWLVWICIAAVFVEAIVLFTNKWKCPFTILGYKYASNRTIGFDIFLPTWLAKHNKVIFSSLFSIGFALVLWRVLSN
jgi:hypothetical protein